MNPDVLTALKARIAPIFIEAERCMPDIFTDPKLDLEYPVLIQVSVRQLRELAAVFNPAILTEQPKLDEQDICENCDQPITGTVYYDCAGIPLCEQCHQDNNKTP